MRYLLNKRYLLRGWLNAHTGVVDTHSRTTRFLPKDEYLLLLRCDGAHGIAEAAQAQKEATEAAAETLEQLGDEDLEAVAGGMASCGKHILIFA